LIYGIDIICDIRVFYCPRSPPAARPPGSSSFRIPFFPQPPPYTPPTRRHGTRPRPAASQDTGLSIPLLPARFSCRLFPNVTGSSQPPVCFPPPLPPLFPTIFFAKFFDACMIFRPPQFSPLPCCPMVPPSALWSSFYYHASLFSEVRSSFSYLCLFERKTPPMVTGMVSCLVNLALSSSSASARTSLISFHFVSWVSLLTLVTVSHSPPCRSPSLRLDIALLFFNRPCMRRAVVRTLPPLWAVPLIFLFVGVAIRFWSFVFFSGWSFPFFFSLLSVLHFPLTFFSTRVPTLWRLGISVVSSFMTAFFLLSSC